MEAFRQEKIRRATEAQRRAALADIDGSKARCVSLAGFIKEAWHVLHPRDPLVWNWHLDLICAHLEAITWGRMLAMGLDNRMLFNIPPGTMKSLTVSVFWQAWEWGPCGLAHMSYLTATYREDYALRDSRRTRDLILSEWYQARWGDKVTLKGTGERRFENTAQGWRWAVPFASMTAGRAHRVIIDDPHSVDTAESDQERARVTIRFRESVQSRLVDPIRSAIVVMMQRLHSADVSGEIKRLDLPFVHVMLPMEFEPDRKCETPFGSDPRTQADELLDPVRFPRAVVDRDKKGMGAYAVAGQFQQRPSPREGSMFKREWFKLTRIIPAGVRISVRGWDLAASIPEPGQQPAYTAGCRLHYHIGTGGIYIDSMVRDRRTPGGVEALIEQTAQTDCLRYPSIRTSIPQDPGQSGKSQVWSWAKLLVGHSVRFSPESGSKIDRADPVSAQAEAGNVWIVSTGDPASDAWIEPFLAEVALFPGSTFKDQIDAMSRAFMEAIRIFRSEDYDSADVQAGVVIGAQVGRGEKAGDVAPDEYENDRY